MGLRGTFWKLKNLRKLEKWKDTYFFENLGERTNFRKICRKIARGIKEISEKLLPYFAHPLPKNLNQILRTTSGNLK